MVWQQKAMENKLNLSFYFHLSLLIDKYYRYAEHHR